MIGLAIAAVPTGLLTSAFSGTKDIEEDEA